MEASIKRDRIRKDHSLFEIGQITKDSEFPGVE